MIQFVTRQIHGSFIFGLLLFAGVAYNAIQNRDPATLVPNESLQTMVPIIALTMAVLGQIFSRYLLKGFKPSVNKKSEYIKKYQTVKLIQWAGVEGGALLNMATYFVTGNSMNFYFGIGFALVLPILYPNEKDLFSLFKISEKDLEEKLESEDSF